MIVQEFVFIGGKIPWRAFILPSSNLSRLFNIELATVLSTHFHPKYLREVKFNVFSKIG